MANENKLEPDVDPDCPFCAIITGDAPAIRIYEMDHSLSLVPQSPGFRGHLMVIPKAHRQDLLELLQTEFAEILEHSQRIANSLLEVGFDGFNLINANGEAAQQSVFHFHMHIVPRKSGDGIDIWAAENDQGIYDDSLYDKIADEIK